MGLHFVRNVKHYCNFVLGILESFILFPFLLCEGIGVPLVLKIMEEEEGYCQAEDIDSIPETVLLDLNL